MTSHLETSLEQIGFDVARAIDAAVALRKTKDAAYAERDRLVALLASFFPSSVEQHLGAEWEDDWRNVVFIDLPTGQVTWHIHDSELPLFAHVPRSQGRKWDGHTNDVKWNRVATLAAFSKAKAVRP